MSPSHDPSQPPRRFRTAFGVVSTQECEMRELRAGERFVGPDGRTVYRVVTPCGKHRRGWLVVRNLSMTDREAARLQATPGAVAVSYTHLTLPTNREV